MRVLNILDDANLQLKAEKCVIAHECIEWLRFKLTQTGISPVNAKSQGTRERLRPTNLKQLRSLLGAINQFNKFIPNLATKSHPFRSIYKRTQSGLGTKIMKKHLYILITKLKTVELSHFKRNQELAMPAKVDWAQFYNKAEVPANGSQ